MLTISEQASVRVKTYDSATGEGTIKLDFSGMATLHCPPITFKKKAQVRYVILLALCRRATDQVMPRMSLPTPKAFLYMYKVVLSTGALAPALSLPSLSMMHRPSTSMLRRASSTTSPLPSPRSSIALTRTPSSCTSRCPRRRRLVPRSCRTFQSRSRPPRAATRRPICKPRSQRPEWLEQSRKVPPQVVHLVALGRRDGETNLGSGLSRPCACKLYVAPRAAYGCTGYCTAGAPACAAHRTRSGHRATRRTHPSHTPRQYCQNGRWQLQRTSTVRSKETSRGWPVRTCENAEMALRDSDFSLFHVRFRHPVPRPYVFRSRSENV